MAVSLFGIILPDQVVDLGVHQGIPGLLADVQLIQQTEQLVLLLGLVDDLRSHQADLLPLGGGHLTAFGLIGVDEQDGGQVAEEQFLNLLGGIVPICSLSYVCFSGNLFASLWQFIYICGTHLVELICM